ncbi:hypothetical protein [uncultured Pseudodesulfovibrio sp.]|uniref:hypothetical protein n=1 Tax=uncultured Pseudodesulfovibrio sp. TaxID=2035858 RepID=UPI0029C85C6A|nr:hypothetical protein [uncultured Pseudodesulfovibrio sp.]
MPIHLINATHLKNWRGRQPQNDLPTLIRDLIWATTNDLIHISVPGGDSVYRPGFDGVVIAGNGTPFVPYGRSVWEIGTDNTPKGKAESDYQKRSKNSDKETTFIFVTPREFQDKDDWCKIKQKEGLWKDVRVYDCDDIENWLSIAPSISTLWMERVSNIAPDKIMPSIFLWEEWKLAMGGLLSPQLICSGVEREKCCFAVLDWLVEEEPSILRLKSYSHQDGQLFLASSLGYFEGFGDWLIRCVTTNNESSLRQLIASETPLLIATPIDKAGLARQALANGHKYCIITTRSATNFPEQDTVIEIPLRLASYEAQKELKQLGMPEPQAEILLRKTGRMLMALRREIAGEHPCWAEPGIRHVMSSVVLAPGWNEKLPEDREALESLSGQQYSEIEKTIKAVRITPESPLQYVDPFWKLLSPMDAWRCLGPQLSTADFERFREVVVAAFTAPDPVMDLPPDKRWAAAIYKKRTPYSGLIRKGLLQSLIIIAEFGKIYLPETLDSPQGWINSLVANIFLACREQKKWEALNSSLKELAEAAPTVFLTEIERRLADDKPSMAAFFKKNDDILFGGNPHVSLIWALERLAWFPEHLHRVAIILTKLNEIDPGGNMNPRPLGALQGIFCQMLPQTMASWEEQQSIINTLAEYHPDSSFDLLNSLIPRFGKLLGHSNKPDWREVTPKKTQYWHEVYTRAEWHESKLIELAGNNGELWAKIIEKFNNVRPETRKTITARLNALISKDELEHREALRGQIRRTLHARKTYTDSEEDLAELNSLETIYNALLPSNILERHRWLFENWPAMPNGRKGMSFKEKEIQLRELRKNALSEILVAMGVDGVLKLANQVESPYVVGHTFGYLMSEEQWDEFYNKMDFEDTSSAEFAKACIHTTLDRFGEKWVRHAINKSKEEKGNPQFLANACLTLPSGREQWELVTGLSDEVDKEYWSTVSPYKLFGNDTCEEDRTYAFNKLKTLGRTNALLDLSSSTNYLLTHRQRIDALFTYLEHPDSLVSAYELQETLNLIRESTERNDQEIIQLEWIFFKIYSPDPPQLVIHEQMAKDIKLFKEMIQISKGAHETISKDLAFNAFEILRSWKTIPGSLDDGSIDPVILTQWVNQIRTDYSQTDDKDLIDSIIGELLAHSPIDKEGRFPCEMVCRVLENNLTKSMENGFAVSIHNKRGTYSRSPYEGGQQEREIAKEYKRWAKEWQIQWPKVAALLNSISEDYEREGKWHDREKLHDDMYY